MKKIIVRKILKYDPTMNGGFSRYEGYCQIGLRMADPGIVPGQKLIETNSKAFRSPRKRAEESINNAEILEYLDEVKFDLKRLVSEEEYNQFGSNLVRQKFTEAFIKDELEEKRNDIRERIYKLERILKQDTLLVSHSFFMKILETYLINNELFDKPKILFDYLKPEQKTYNFGEGFEFCI